MNLKKVKENITESKTSLFIGLAIIALIIIIILDFFDTEFSIHDILVEFHGLVFDLFIFGIILTIYETRKTEIEKIKQKKKKRIELIQRYTEEINDYRFWKSEEAMYRTRGLIKRLVDLDTKDLDLSHCYLATDKSFGTYRNMQNWKFSGANLIDSFFCLSDMQNADFYISNLKGARFDQVNLTNCRFGSAILYKTEFLKCNFENVELDDSIVGTNQWFEELEYHKNKGIELLKEKYQVNSEPEIINDIKVYRIRLK